MNRLIKWAIRRYAMKKLKLLSNSIQWANVAGFAAQFLGILPPSLQSNKYVMALQGIIGVLLPSLNGIGHKLIFNKPQE